MSSLGRDTILTIAESIGIAKVRDAVADALARDIEEKVRELAEDALRFMKHAHRDTLTTDDINHALRMRNVEPLYGYSSSDPITFRKTAGPDDVFYVEDTIVKLEDVLSEPLPRCPMEPTFSVHWLAVEGVQPTIPQNPSVSAIAAAEAAAAAHQEDGEPATKKRKLRAGGLSKLPQTVKPQVKHVLSKEQQMFYEHVTAAVKGNDEILKLAAFKSLSNDEGLHQLLPYFTQFIAEEVTYNLKDLPLLKSLMHMARCLLVSPHLHIEPYLHQLLPSILTCVVGKRLCNLPSEDHWSLRDFAASLVALVCSTYGHSYNTLQMRITKTLAKAFLDPSKPLTTHYGAIVGLSSLGTPVTQALLLPHIRVYLQLLDSEMKQTQNPVKQAEATRCYGALQSAAGQFIRQELKLAEPSRVPFGVDKDVEDRDDDMGVKEVKALPAPAATAAAKSKAAAATSAASKDKSGKPAIEVKADPKAALRRAHAAVGAQVAARAPAGSGVGGAGAAGERKAGAAASAAASGGGGGTWVAELVELFGEGIHSYAQVSHCGPTAEPLFNLTTTFM